MFTDPFKIFSEAHKPMTMTKEHLDSMIQQLNICENYCKVTKQYLQLTRDNLDLWNNMYIFTDKK